MRIQLQHKYNIYTDGAYSPANNKGGVGFVITEDNQVIFKYSKMFINTTNQRMELMAMIIALESIVKASEVNIITDSMYLVGTLTKGWKKKANLDLWERLDKAMNKHKLVTIEWCKGHDGNIYNEMADELASNASKEL